MKFIDVLSLMIYYVLFVALVYLISGCSFTSPLFSVDMVDTRKITIERNGTRVEISGDIDSLTDYPELHKLLDRDDL